MRIYIDQSKCFECGATKDLQQHHVVPKSLGGTKTITLCYHHHCLVHGIDGKGVDHSERTKEGIAIAKAAGKQIGCPPEKLKELAKKGRETNRKKGTNNSIELALNILVIKEEDMLKPKDISLRKMADKLNSRGFRTPRGEEYQHSSISQMLKRVNLKLEDLR